MRNRRVGNARAALVRVARRRKIAWHRRAVASVRVHPAATAVLIAFLRFGDSLGGAPAGLRRSGEPEDRAGKHMDGSLDTEMPQRARVLPPEIAECLAERRDLWV